MPSRASGALLSQTQLRVQVLDRNNFEAARAVDEVSCFHRS